jgi:cytochrome bd-type quinol oxidase subunit 2
MVTKKYVKDYRLENQKNKKGKDVTRPVYAGNYFVFEKSPEEVKRARTRLTVYGALAVICFVAGLLSYVNKGFSAQYYTLFPFAFCAFPLLYLGFAVYAFYAFKGRATREQKEKMIDRLEKSGLVTVVLSALCMVGLLIAMILKIAGKETRPVTVNDFIFIAAAVLLLVISLLVFGLRKDLKMIQEVSEEENSAAVEDPAGGESAGIDAVNEASSGEETPAGD